MMLANAASRSRRSRTDSTIGKPDRARMPLRFRSPASMLVIRTRTVVGETVSLSTMESSCAMTSLSSLARSCVRTI